MARLNVNIGHAAAYVTFLECLIDGPHTIGELHEESGFSLNTIKKFLRIAKRRKRIFVAAWENDSIGRPVIPAYQWGSKPDVLRPKPPTATERSAAYRERLRRVRLNLQGNTMKLYQTTSTAYGQAQGAPDIGYMEFASSSDGASKIRTRLKKEGHGEIETKEVEVPTTRTELIAFLNTRLAHESWKPSAVADKLTSP